MENFERKYEEQKTELSRLVIRTQNNVSNTQNRLNQATIDNTQATNLAQQDQQLDIDIAFREQALLQSQQRLTEINDSIAREERLFQEITQILNDFSALEMRQLNPTTLLVENVSSEGIVQSGLLKDAIQKQHIEDFNEILARVDNINIQDSEGKTLLMHAIINGFKHGVDILLQRNADVNHLDHLQHNALIYAAAFPDITYFKTIADRTDNLSICDGNKNSLLHLVIQSTNACIYSQEFPILNVRPDQQIFVGSNLTITEGSWIVCNIPEIRRDGFTVNQQKTLYLLKYLIEEKGLSINVQNNQKLTPFFVACDYKFAYLVRNLMEIYNEDIDFSVKDYRDDTYLHYVSLIPHSIDVLRTIFSKNINVNVKNIDHVTPAFLAAARNNPETLSFLIDQGADLTMLSIDKRHMWHYASKYAALDSMKFLRDIRPAIIDLKTADGINATALQIAAQLNYLPIVQWLVANGADINLKILNTGLTAFFMACEKKNIAVAEFLFNQPSFDNSLVDVNGQGSLHWALKFRDSSWLQNVINKGNINIDMRDIDGLTVLHWASKYNLPEIVTFLINNNANPLISNKLGGLAIHEAVYADAIEVIRILGDSNGINQLSIGDSKATPLYIAAQEGKLEIVRALVELGADINIKTLGSGLTAFFAACLKKSIAIAEFLFNQPSFNNALVDDTERGSLHWALEFRDISWLQNVINKGNIDINMRDINGLTVLHWASKYNLPEIVTFLITNNADPLISNKLGGLAIHEAVYADAIEVIRILGDSNGINQLSTGDSKATPLYIAAQEGKLEIVRALIDLGADINIKISGDGLTPFFKACAMKNIAVAEFLFNQPSFNNALVDNNGQGSLHWALEFRDISWLQNVINKGNIDINMRDINGLTVLHWASKYNLPEIVTFLITNNADPLIPNKLGGLAIHEAVAANALEVIEIIADLNGTQNKLSTKAVLYSRIAKIAENNKDSYGAVRYNIKSIEAHKEQPEVYEKLGQLFFSKGQYSKAIEVYKIIGNDFDIKLCFKAWLGQDPRNPDIMLKQAEYFESIGLFESAKKYYRHAFSLSKNENTKATALEKIGSIMTNAATLGQSFIKKAQDHNFFNYDLVDKEFLNNLVDMLKLELIAGKDKIASHEKNKVEDCSKSSKLSAEGAADNATVSKDLEKLAAHFAKTVGDQASDGSASLSSKESATSLRFANKDFFYRGNDIVKIWEQYLKSIDLDIKFYCGGNNGNSAIVDSLFNHLTQNKETAIVIKNDGILYQNKDGKTITLCGEINYEGAHDSNNSIKTKIQKVIAQIKNYNAEGSNQTKITNHIVIFPYHAGPNHWNLGQIELNFNQDTDTLLEATIEIYEPFGGYSTGYTSLIKSTNSLGDFSTIKIKQKEHDGNIPIRQQNDSSSCGAITAENGKEFLKNHDNGNNLLQAAYERGAARLRQQHIEEINEEDFFRAQRDNINYVVEGDILIKNGAEIIDLLASHIIKPEYDGIKSIINQIRSNDDSVSRNNLNLFKEFLIRLDLADESNNKISSSILESNGDFRRGGINLIEALIDRINDKTKTKQPENNDSLNEDISETLSVHMMGLEAKFSEDFISESG